MKAEQNQNLSIPKCEQINLNRVSSKPQSSHCGYCNNYGSYSWGLTRNGMHPYTYEMLAERGWRRCGTYYYKPDVKASCCKLWTHRMEAEGFKIKKDQRKTIRHVAEWLVGGNEHHKPEQMQLVEGKEKEEKPKVEMPASNPKKEEAPKMQAQIPQKYHNLSSQTSCYLLKKLSENLQTLTQQLPISPEQGSQNFRLPDDLSKIKCFLPQQSREHDCDFYNNFLMLLFGINKASFQKGYACLDFVSDVAAFVADWLRDWGREKVFVEVERSGYLLFLELDGEKMKNRIKKDTLKKERQAEMKPQSKTPTQNIIPPQSKRQGDKNTQKQTQKQPQPPSQAQKQPQPPSQTNKQPQPPSQANKQSYSNKPEQQKQVSKNMQNKPAKQEKGDKSSKKQEQPKEKNAEKQQSRIHLSFSSTKIEFGPLSIQVVPAEVTDESWRMYQSYCEHIHEQAQKSKNSYSNFLCLQALAFVTEKTDKKCEKTFTPSWQAHEEEDQKDRLKISGTRTKPMGCFHMKYYVKHELIAVGVVDILPHGLSSVYFFYEPKYGQYRLGVFSSLIEIEYVRWLSLSFPQFKYYYMGFYIQNSQKMQYKGNYQPFHLLCPVTYKFIEFTKPLQEKITKCEEDANEPIMLSETNNIIADMKFETDIGVYISQRVKFRYQGKDLKLQDLNPQIVGAVLGILRSMLLVWGKQLFDLFIFTF